MSDKIILLVEDTRSDEALTLQALASSHVKNKVIVVRDGAEALDYILGTGKYAGRDVFDHPQIVLLDLKLPKVDGLDVLRRIRSDSRTVSLPVVILTSSNEEKDVVESYRLGVNSYVRKPVEFSEFMEAVRQLGLYWVLINETPP